MNRRQIIKLAFRALSQYRKAERRWFEQAREGTPIHCEKGCTHCCYQLALGSLTSGVLIADQLLRTDPERLAAVESQGDAQCLVFAREGMTGAADIWFTRHHQACALLKEDGLCTVYDFRPTHCSSYYVVDAEGGFTRESCSLMQSGTRVASLNNQQVNFLSMQLDAEFIAAVSGRGEMANAAMLAPLGTMVKMGHRLLDGDIDGVCNAGIEVMP